jgi:hypothetical protein
MSGPPRSGADEAHGGFNNNLLVGPGSWDHRPGLQSSYSKDGLPYSLSVHTKVGAADPRCDSQGHQTWGEV